MNKSDYIITAWRLILIGIGVFEPQWEVLCIRGESSPFGTRGDAKQNLSSVVVPLVLVLVLLLVLVLVLLLLLVVELVVDAEVQQVCTFIVDLCFLLLMYS